MRKKYWGSKEIDRIIYDKLYLKALFRASQTISIKHNKIHHVQTPSCFQNLFFNLTSETVRWCLIIVLFFYEINVVIENHTSIARAAALISQEKIIVSMVLHHASQ